MHPNLSLVLPCYNEAEHFNLSVEKILQILRVSKLSFEIIFVEDKSNDNTKVLLTNFLKGKPRNYKAIFHSKNRGRGQSLMDGFREAKGTYVGFIDLDGEISPIYIPRALKFLKSGADVVCGYRHYKMGISGLARAVASKTYTLVVFCLFGPGLKDTEAGFKFFKRERIISLLPHLKNQGWFWDTEVMVLSRQRNLKIAYLPVQFNRRSDKTSTVRVIPDSFNYLKDLIKFRFNTNG